MLECRLLKQGYLMFLLYIICLGVSLFHINQFKSERSYRTHHKTIKVFKNNKKPDWVVNKIWGIDLTDKHDSDKCNQHILGIIDHGS